jgi:hypothetical protein
MSKIAGIRMKNPAHPGDCLKSEIRVAPDSGLPAGNHHATTLRELAAQERNGA